MSAEEARFSPDLNRSELRNVVAMAIPMVITTCSPMVMRVADFTFVSRLGIDAKAAILPAQMLLWCYLAWCIGTVSAVNTVAAQSLGRGRRPECSAYAWQGLYLAILTGGGGALLWFTYPAIFEAIGHAPRIRELEIAYARVGVFSFIPTVAAAALGSFFTGIHRPWTTMVAAVEANALNIVLDYGLIFGKWGLPECGFTGAASATVIAAAYQVLRLLAVFLSAKTDSVYHSRSTWGFDGTRLKPIWQVGYPIGFQWLSDVIVWAVFVTVLIGRFGEVALAASNTAWQFIRIGFMPMIGVGEALTALVGRAIGQQRPDRARRVTNIAIAITFLYVGSLSVVYVKFRYALMGLFNVDPAVIALGGSIMVCVAIFQLADVLGTCYYFALRGAGDTRWTMVMFIVGHWLVVIGGGSTIVALRPDLGAMGPWAVATSLICLTGLMLRWRWRGGAWEHIRLLGRVERDEDSDSTDVASDLQEEPVPTAR